MRNIGKSTGQLEWWAPPFFFTSETPDVPARPKNAIARKMAARWQTRDAATSHAWEWVLAASS